MTRETRLSSLAEPQSRQRHPHSREANPGSPNTTRVPPASSTERQHTSKQDALLGPTESAERRQTITQDASLRPPTEHPLWMLSGRRRVGPGMQPGFVLVLRRGPGRKSTVCGLNRFLPSAEPDGSLHLNPRPVSQSSRLLPSGPFCAVSTGELPFPVWKEKLQCKPTFLSNSGIDRFPESKEKAQPGASRNGDGQFELTITNTRILL
jgi:hypothetical protein